MNKKIKEESSSCIMIPFTNFRNDREQDKTKGYRKVVNDHREKKTFQKQMFNLKFVDNLDEKIILNLQNPIAISLNSQCKNNNVNFFDEWNEFYVNTIFLVSEVVTDIVFGSTSSEKTKKELFASLESALLLKKQKKDLSKYVEETSKSLSIEFDKTSSIMTERFHPADEMVYFADNVAKVIRSMIKWNYEWNMNVLKKRIEFLGIIKSVLFGYSLFLKSAVKKIKDQRESVEIFYRNRAEEIDAQRGNEDDTMRKLLHFKNNYVSFLKKKEGVQEYLSPEMLYSILISLEEIIQNDMGYLLKTIISKVQKALEDISHSSSSIALPLSTSSSTPSANKIKECEEKMKGIDANLDYLEKQLISHWNDPGWSQNGYESLKEKLIRDKRKLSENLERLKIESHKEWEEIRISMKIAKKENLIKLIKTHKEDYIRNGIELFETDKKRNPSQSSEVKYFRAIDVLNEETKTINENLEKEMTNHIYEKGIQWANKYSSDMKIFTESKKEKEITLKKQKENIDAIYSDYKQKIYQKNLIFVDKDIQKLQRISTDFATLFEKNIHHSLAKYERDVILGLLEEFQEFS